MIYSWIFIILVIVISTIVWFRARKPDLMYKRENELWAIFMYSIVFIFILRSVGSDNVNIEHQATLIKGMAFDLDMAKHEACTLGHMIKVDPSGESVSNRVLLATSVYTQHRAVFKRLKEESLPLPFETVLLVEEYEPLYEKAVHDYFDARRREPKDFGLMQSAAYRLSEIAVEYERKLLNDPSILSCDQYLEAPLQTRG